MSILLKRERERKKKEEGEKKEENTSEEMLCEIFYISDKDFTVVYLLY